MGDVGGRDQSNDSSSRQSTLCLLRVMEFKSPEGEQKEKSLKSMKYEKARLY